jgi:serine/threonine protein kinase
MHYPEVFDATIAKNKTLVNLLIRCFEFNYQERPTAEEVLDDEFFSTSDCLTVFREEKPPSEDKFNQIDTAELFNTFMNILHSEE